MAMASINTHKGPEIHPENCRNIYFREKNSTPAGRNAAMHNLNQENWKHKEKIPIPNIILKLEIEGMFYIIHKIPTFSIIILCLLRTKN